MNDMQLQVALADPNGARAPLRSNFDDRDGWEPTECPADQLSFPTSVVGQTGVLHRMDPVACRPITKCRKTGGSRSCPLSVVEYWCTAGKETATCRICGKTFRRCNVTLSDSKQVSKIPLLPCLDVAGWVSWSDLAREQSVNEEHSRDVSSPLCAQRIETLRRVCWFMWCQAPSRGGRSSIRHARPRSCVFCRCNRSSFSCVRTPCCFFWFWWSKDFDEFFRVIWWVLWKRYTSRGTQVSSAHIVTLSLMVSLESSWCRVPRT